MSARHALFPGSFDPITRGHVDLVRRSARLFERVTVLVAAHDSKSGLFSLEERLELVQATLADVAGVAVAASSGLLVDACREHGAQVVVRGLRGATDLEYELQMAHTNSRLAPGHETLFLAPSPELGYVSSSLVRQIARLGGDVAPFVSPPVLRALQQRFPN